MRLFQKIFNRAKQSDGSYKLSSFWTAADTVEFNDGETLEECKTSMEDALDQKGDGLFYDDETKMLYLLSGENRLSGVEITTSGTGEVLGDVSDVSATPDTTSVTLKWTDPVDGQEVEWGGTTVIRKQGSRPVDCLDGTVVVDSTTRNQYRTTGYEDDNLNKNTLYYYRFFPYTTEGQIRTGLAVGVTTLKDETCIEEFPTISGTYVYDGTEKTVVLNDFDADKMVISSGNTGTNAGEYQVCITPKTGCSWPDGSTDPIYLDWTIQKALISIIPSQSGTITYTGTSRTPDWSGYDSNKLTIGGDTSGTNAGTYTATFTPKSNYTWGDSTTTAKDVNWSIQKATISTIPTQDGVLNYTGSVLTPSWNDYDNTKMTISGQTSGTNAGDYIAVFTPTSNYTWSDGTTSGKEVQWRIVNKTIGNVPSQSGTLTYTGSSQTPSWNNYDSTKLSVTGDSGTNAGSYTATFTPRTGYMWSDGTTTGKSVTWTIGRATISNIPSTSSSLTYNGFSQSPTWSYYDSAKMTIGGTTSAINAGTYTATFTPTSNYQWSGSSTTAKSVSWTIDKASGTLTLSKQNMSFSTVNATDTSTASSYNGTLSATTSNSSVATVSISGSTITVTCKGTGSASITVKSAATTNYYEVVKTISVSANTTQTVSVPSQSGTLTYSGSSQSPTWSNYDSSQLTIGGTTSGTNAGTYTATFTPKSGYAWSDGTTVAKSVEWSIGRASGTLTLSSYSVNISGAGSTSTVTASGYNGSLSVSTSNRDVATASVSGSTVTITGVSSGTAYIYVTSASTTNYYSVYKTITVTVAASKTIGNLAVGSLVKDVNGTLYGKPMIYRIIGKNHCADDVSAMQNTVSLEARDIVACKYYNSSGNVEYKNSSLRTWLNGTFYNNSISTKLKNSIITSTIYTRVHVPNGSSSYYSADYCYYTTNDKVFVLSASEKNARKVFGEGMISESDATFNSKNTYEYYNEAPNSTRQKVLTAEAVTNADVKNTYNSSFAANHAWYQWCRGSQVLSMSSTPNWTVSTIHENGSYDYSGQDCGWNGVSPAMTVSNTLVVSNTTDSDGCYTIQ